MFNEFEGIGNLAEDPKLVIRQVEGEGRAVVNIRVYFDRPTRQEDNSYKDKDGFWLNVSLWGRLAEDAAKLYVKGMRLYFEGELKITPWVDPDSGEEREKKQLDVSRCFIDPICLESVAMKPKKQLQTSDG